MAGELNRYEVELNGIRTTVQYTEAEARRRGLLESGSTERKAGRAPANKARTAADKAGTPEGK